MANPVNPFDFANETLAQFLAKTVDDGTYADVVEALKTDQVGEEAAATEIRIAAGQIYGNTLDDFVLAAYPLLAQVAAGGAGADTTQPISDVVAYGVLAGSTVSLAAGARAEALDMSTAGAAITIDLPQIAPAFDGVGVRCSFVVATGNAGQDLIVNAFAGDGVVDPATGLSQSTITYSAGSLSGYTVLTWEGVVDVAQPVDPASSIDTFAPATEFGSAPNAGAVSCTVTGTGGTLPTIPNMIVTMPPLSGGLGQATLVSPGDITITSAVQGGGPGTAWTVTFDILPGEITAGGGFHCQIDDATGPTVPFAGMTWAFQAYPTGPGQNPSQTPVPAAPGGVLSLWMHDTSNPIASVPRWDEALDAGPNSFVHNPTVNLGDSFILDDRTGGTFDPSMPPSLNEESVGFSGGGFRAEAFHRKFAFTASVTPGGGSFVDCFTVFDDGGPNLTGSVLAVKIIVDALFVMEEVWRDSSGSWFRYEMRKSSGIDGLNVADDFRLIGSGGNLVLQMKDDRFSPFVRGVVEFTFAPGSTPS